MNLDEVLIVAASVLALALTLQLGYSMLNAEDLVYKEEILYLVNVSMLSLSPGSSLKLCLPYPIAFNSSDLKECGVPAYGRVGGSCLEITKSYDGVAEVGICEP